MIDRSGACWELKHERHADPAYREGKGHGYALDEKHREVTEGDLSSRTVN